MQIAPDILYISLPWNKFTLLRLKISIFFKCKQKQIFKYKQKIINGKDLQMALFSP